METLLLIIAFLVYISYVQRNFAKEKELLIREMSIAIKSNSVLEYKEAREEVRDETIDVIEDELVSVDQIEPEVLLRSLR